MNTKLQELTDKIYLEGVEKGNAEAKALVEKANAEAAEIVAKAKAEADKLMQQAQAQADELSKNTRSELRLFSQQAVNALKSEITNVVSGSIVSDSVKAATADKAFMQKVILTLVQAWASNQEVSIEAKDADALTAYFAANAKTLLNNGVSITQVNNLKADFTVKSEKEGYKISLGEDQFIEYFKEFLRPKLIELLF